MSNELKQINDLRDSYREKERAHVKLISMYLEQERKNFEYADTSIWLLQDKKDSDVIFVSEKLIEFQSKIKPGTENHKLFSELILAILRIQSYTHNMETLNQQSVAKYATEKKTNDYLNSEIRKMNILHNEEISQLTKKLENAKKEIDFGKE